MAKLIDVTGVEVIAEHKLRLTFADGSITTSPGAGGSASSNGLQDPVYFCRVVVDHEVGTIVWPNGADVAPKPRTNWR